ncbi:MAG TPA: BMC domain-containing protein [Bacteroidota bacterium]|nr:BMC domain-containing protein [Bacteroidota bacterium]
MAERNSIGIIELASIYKGFSVQDEVLKSANVEKLLGRTICSGKYLIAVRGSAGDIDVALETAREVGGFAIVNAVAMRNVDDRIFPAIAGVTPLQIFNAKKIDAVLVIETFSVASAIKAADVAAKEADIDILRIHVAMAIGGKGFAVFTGSIDALESASKKAVDSIKHEGMLAGFVIIKNPHPEVLRELL